MVQWTKFQQNTNENGGGPTFPRITTQMQEKQRLVRLSSRRSSSIV
ncbi:Uncharacterized protein APZ42_032587 [Daphnia magna]|uniref:Uncharacterized protein n=1 Tax=Daphnia magna TaxID=35525 RepID=A0A164LPD5_9CRUS|nr:Uncharacterized protein APZ42_032587 [Daphnia magna]